MSGDGGWVSDLFNGPNKSQISHSNDFGFQLSQAGEQARRAKSGPKPVGMDRPDSDVVRVL